MKKVFFLGISIILLTMSFVYADSVQDSVYSIQKQISENQLNYLSTNSQQAQVNPSEILIKAFKNNPEVRREIIKSFLFIIFLIILSIADVVLRGFAMWKACKNNSKLWFWLLLLLSTLCILPLIYLYLNRNKKSHDKKE